MHFVPSLDKKESIVFRVSLVGKVTKRQCVRAKNTTDTTQFAELKLTQTDSAKRKHFQMYKSNEKNMQRNRKENENIWRQGAC